MKTTSPSETPEDQPLPDDLVEELMADDMLPEYDFDYTKARPNRFAAGLTQIRMVKLAPDIAAAFPTEQAVNDALRKLLESSNISV
jgi:hypothetical protein